MKRLTNYHLKIIAIITMVIDHTCKLFTQPIALFLQQTFPEPFDFLIYIAIESLGRISFVLFAYLISVGCYHTHDIKKYISRLFLFGIISEIPFQYFVSLLSNQTFHLQLAFTNIFFTLALGALAIAGYQHFQEYLIKKFLPLFLSCIAAFVIHCDYDVFGVLLIFSFYYFQDFKKMFLAVGTLLLGYYVGYLSYLYGITLYNIMNFIFMFIYALFGCIIIYFYNGLRGRKLKFIFYLFYPVHLIVLCWLYQVF